MKKKPMMWIMKITPDEPGKTIYYFKELFLEENSPKVIGYYKDSGDKIETFKNRFQKINIGDIVVVMEGMQTVHGCVIITSNAYDKTPNWNAPDWFEHCRKAELLKAFNPFQAKGKTNRDTIIEYSGEGAKSICDEVWELIQSDYQKFIIEQKKNAKMQHYINLLKQKQQIIFTGAPGTGKTYLAREIAGSLVEDEKIQINFVQFHPSYDYTDFMEGLRPIMRGDNQLGFELKNGTFKEFCRKAGVIERLKCAGIETLTEQNLVDFLGKDTDIYKFWNIPEYVGKAIKELEEDLPKFVFLIDEINRAEISKVFGELFFSIDVGYRGEKGKIKTQYPNMQNEKTFFVNKEDDYFFVPSNVYIIGTMNDIDRSVEMFDFAMRRRFAWEEIKVETTLDNILSELKDETLQEQAKAKTNALNTAISEIEGLNSSYHVGGAYFLKLKEDNSFENLWKYHLETLLKEYLRGLPDAEQKLNNLKQVYDKAN